MALGTWKASEIMWPTCDQPLHRTFLQPLFWLVLITPDQALWASPSRSGRCCKTSGWNAPPWPGVTWLLPEITWSSHDNHATTCHLVSRLLSQWTRDLRVPTLFIFPSIFTILHANAS